MPASSPHVTAAGGTHLVRSTNARGWTETAWPRYLCTAVAGYDGPTGLGTPNGSGAFQGYLEREAALPSSAWRLDGLQGGG
ncbi:MAG TPA: hypothetical protein VFA45_16475, partial [Actinomycetes bacterium]|nr:hypothetical protein [Actinomycetes bacterium]